MVLGAAFGLLLRVYSRTLGALLMYMKIKDMIGVRNKSVIYLINTIRINLKSLKKGYSVNAKKIYTICRMHCDNVCGYCNAYPIFIFKKPLP